MKKLVVAMSNDTTFDDDMKMKVEQFEKMLGAQLQGIIQYPKGLPVIAPQVMANGIEMTKADYVVTASPDFLISEVVNNLLITNTLKRKGIESYELDFELRFDELVERIPSQFKEHLQSEANTHDETFNKMENKNILLIADKSSEVDILNYLSEMSKDRNVAQLVMLQVNEFGLDTVNEVEQIIKDENIGEVVFYDKFNTPEYDDLINTLQDSDVGIAFRGEEHRMSEGMLMN